MMFSLEALMKATAGTRAEERGAGQDEVSDQLWNMQAATPLFGTAHDQALLTTPLKLEPAPSTDSMTLPSETPSGRRWWPIVAAVSAGLALAGGGVWLFGGRHGADPLSGPSSSQAALAAQPPAAELAPPVSPPEPAREAEAAAAPTATEPAALTEPAAAGPAAAGETAPSADAAAAGEQPAPAEAATAAGAASPSEAKDAKDKLPTSKKPAARPSAPSSQKAAAAFDKSAAKAALNDAADRAVQCGQGGAPGKGKVQVTFAPSGKVSAAELVDGPFAGTAAGKCALRQFRSAKIPAFSGAAVTVAKSFKID